MYLNLEELHYYPLMVSLNRCNGSCNTHDDLSSRIWVPKETEDVNLSGFNMITRTNESKTLTKHISCDCKHKFDGRKCNSNQQWNKHLHRRVYKTQQNITYMKKNIFEILRRLLDEHSKSIIGDSVITCNEITDAVAQSYDDTSDAMSKNNKKATCNLVCYISCTMLSATKLLPEIAIICQYFKKHCSKQKDKLPYYYIKNGE